MATQTSTTVTTAPSLSPSSSSSPPFPFPREYRFPAFFTRQPNLTTHHAQLRKWSALILSYARHHRLFRVSLSSAAESDLFHNKPLRRRLLMPDIREVVEAMRKEGTAEYSAATSSSSSFLNAGGGGGGGGLPAAGGDVVLLWWNKVDEWAAMVEKFVEDTGQKGSVLTVYELSQGEGTRGTELHGIDTEVLMKALNVLVKKGRAQIFGSDDSLGVKFF